MGKMLKKFDVEVTPDVMFSRYKVRVRVFHKNGISKISFDIKEWTIGNEISEILKKVEEALNELKNNKNEFKSSTDNRESD